MTKSPVADSSSIDNEGDGRGFFNYRLLSRRRRGFLNYRLRSRRLRIERDVKVVTGFFVFHYRVFYYYFFFVLWPQGIDAVAENVQVRRRRRRRRRRQPVAVDQSERR